MTLCCILLGCDDTQVPAAKRSKVESEEGERIIAMFLSSVQKLASSDISDAALATKLEQLKLEFLQTDNDYVKSILRSVSYN